MKKNSFDIDKFSLNCRRLLQVFFTPSVTGGVKTTPSNNRLKFRIGPVRENPSKERLKISRTAKLESETSYASEDIAPPQSCEHLQKFVWWGGESLQLKLGDFTNFTAPFPVILMHFP